MAADEGNGAFVKGLILGGLAGVGAMIWNAPQAGARTREQIQERLEGVLFKVLDFPQSVRGEAAQTVEIANEPPVAADMLIPPSLGEAAVPEPVPDADVVIDAPRPVDAARSSG